MSEILEEYMMLPYIVRVVPEPCTDGSMCYLAEHPELPGCMSHGETPEQALENLRDARHLYIETLLQKDQPVPKPQQIIEEVEFQGVIWTVLAAPSEVDTLTSKQGIVKKGFPDEISPSIELDDVDFEPIEEPSHP